jgi:hypothetical protein
MSPISAAKISMCGSREAFFDKPLKITGVRLNFAKFGEPEGMG